MKKIVFTSDWHLGLYTSEINRTSEIVQVCLNIVKHAIKIKADLLVIGGDIFHSNNPNEFLISQFIRILNLVRKYDLKTYVLVGNHDAISNGERKSCLDFVDLFKRSYPSVKLVSDIKCVEWFVADYGHVYLTFFPT